MPTGIYPTKKKDGSTYYRVSITYQNKHISLGSTSDDKQAAARYAEAKSILSDKGLTFDADLTKSTYLPFEKMIILYNFRDHGMYIKNPIYLQKGYFLYFLSETVCLKFDNDDLFYYSSHKIFRRNGHLFVNDYGTQYNIASRYGIKNYAVRDRDYRFVNGDPFDFRYANIEIINKYHGVTSFLRNNRTWYQARLHLNGDIIVGNYTSEVKAAVAYNKAVDFARDLGYPKDFIENYIQELSPKDYAELYTHLHLTAKCQKSIQKVLQKKISEP